MRREAFSRITRGSLSAEEAHSGVGFRTPGLDPSGCCEANSGSLLSTVQRSPSSVTLATARRPSTKSPLGVMKREDGRSGSETVSESERAMLQDSD
ncbi:unnamed protein product [Boreogadus saida]